MRRAVPVAAAAVVVAIAAAAWFLPKLTAERTISYGTPGPQPFFALTAFKVPPHRAACLDSVAVEPGPQAALFGVDPAGRPGPPLRLSLRAPSFRRAVDVAGGYGT